MNDTAVLTGQKTVRRGRVVFGNSGKFVNFGNSANSANSGNFAISKNSENPENFGGTKNA